MSEELVEQFIDLFDGRRDAVGGEDGACIRIASSGWTWKGRLSNHLEHGGDEAIGVYPLVASQFGNPQHDWVVRWGCIDWDEGEGDWVHACNVKALLASFGVTGWIERSRSKGFHLWVFGDRWEPAWMVRRGLLMACTLVGAPIKEINPKSEGFDNPETLGNYVRLPYPGFLTIGWDQVPSVTDRRVVFDDGGVYTLREFVTEATAHRGLDGLRDLAAAWVPPKPRVQREVLELDPGELEDAIRRVGSRTRHVLMDGPGDSGRDRSSTLFWLAQLLVRDGNHTYDECIALLAWSDARTMQKFTGRSDADQRYTDMVDKAWTDGDGENE